MSAIEQCRSAALGGHVLRCDSCGHQEIRYNSCRNRHCPKCQAKAAQRWLEARQADLLPVEYYHVVFTLPAPIVDLAYTNKTVIYRLLFEVAPETPVTVHSDQGSQYSSHDWQHFLRARGLVPSMSRRGNCHDNAVAESFFQLLKRERIRLKIYLDRNEARRDIFDYIEMFYNPKRRHGYTNDVSPIEYEKRYFNRLTSV